MDSDREVAKGNTEPVHQKHSTSCNNVTTAKQIRKRKRPRTKALRTELKTLLEKAILGSSEIGSPALLTAIEFVKIDDTTFAVPMTSVFAYLGLGCIQADGKFLNNSKFSQLSTFALKSISNLARIFRITDRLPSADEQQNTKQKDEVEQEQQHQQLWLVIQTERCFGQEERTVYVDNLPANCTRTKLERRCAQFGSVIHVTMPQLYRIQRRIAQTSVLGGQWPTHSGFAFVHFASKTAARRFCKRYAANSRLKRAHHHHHHVKRSRVILPEQEQQTMDKQQDGKEFDNELQPSLDVSMSFVGDERPENVTEAVEEDVTPNKRPRLQESMEVIQQHKLTDQPNSSFPSSSFVAPLARTVSVSATTTVTSSTTIMYASMNTSRSGNSGDSFGMGADETISPGTVRIRCYSAAESVMSVDESGRETDLDERAETDAGNQQQLGGKQLNKRKGRKNRRKRKSAQMLPIAHGQPPPPQLTLNNLFRHIQVFPLKQYKELRSSYLTLKKTRMETLKKQLQGCSPNGASIGTKEKPENDGMKRTVKRNLRRKRGIRKLMDRAERAKLDAAVNRSD